MALKAELARLLGMRRMTRDRFASPCGYIDAPAEGSIAETEYLLVRGWCLFPGSIVARIEIEFDGVPPQRARLSSPRGEMPGLTDHPSAPISGFECLVRLTDLPGSPPPTRVSAVAHSADGRSLVLDPVTFDVRVAVPESASDDAEQAMLRARTAAHVRPVSPDDGDGVRALVFSHQLPYGGASLYMVELLRRLIRIPGFECTVVSLQDGPLRKELEEMGIPVHLTDPFPVLGARQYEGNLAELAAWAAEGRFNVLFANTLGSYSGADLAGRLGIPCVWSLHESFELPRFCATAFPPDTLDPYVAGRMEDSLRNAAAVVFAADATRRLFVPYADSERHVTMPYGIELDDIRVARESIDRNEVRRALGIDPNERVLLCLGTIEARKSQAMLAEAFSAVADRHPDTVLALVGEVDEEWCAPYAAALRAFTARTGLGSRIRVEPLTPEPYLWHLASDFHVCASDIESLPRSIIEATVFEKPVISTDVFGVPEVIEDGVTGYLCPTRDAGALAATLDRALSADAEELRRITRTAAERAVVRHEPGAYAQQTWNLLSALARDPEADPAQVVADLGRMRNVAPPVVGS